MAKKEIADHSMEKNEIKQDLLYQYFEGRATPLEKTRMEEWLKEEDNQEFFFEVLEEWELANTQFTPNGQNGLKRLVDKINQPHNLIRTDNQTSSRNFLSRKWRWMIAACIATLIAAGILFNDVIQYKTYTTGYAETKSIILNDNSEITLNANSTITIPRFLEWRRDREVWVQGEAFFKVQKKSNRQRFIVHTSHLDVVVLGTRFNVNDRNQKTKVVLEEGRVKVVSSENSKTTLALLEQTGDYMESDGKSSDIVTGKVDHSLYTTWQERKLKFDNASVSDVLQLIDDFYGVTIICADKSILKRNFSGTLPNDNLDIVLQSLSNIYATVFEPEEIKK